MTAQPATDPTWPEVQLIRGRGTMLAVGTVLCDAGSPNKWRITNARMLASGPMYVYRVELVAREYHPRVVYSYEIGPGKAFQVEQEHA